LISRADVLAVEEPMRRLVLSVVAVALLVPMGALAGDDGPPPGTDSPPWDGATYRRMVDDATGTILEVPTLGFRLETRHFDQKTPAYRVKHAFFLSGPDGNEVSVDIFDNPEHLPLARFFETHLGFMKEGNVPVTEGHAGAKKVPALFVEQPKVPGNNAQPSAIFSLAGRIFRVTCSNEDNERAVKAYLHILETLDVGKASR